jgi:ubiquinone/menaquinone biosynthesis C-methylase UbiE
MNIENRVSERYSQGARERQEALCCPVDYDSSLLAMLPAEIIEKDYGCGDPSRYVRRGDHVLDLGSGGGKICYMAAQLVGERGRITGIDMNDDMLALARRYQPLMAERLGGERVRFLKGYIQDLALDLDALEQFLAQHPVNDRQSYGALREYETRQRREQPLIADASVDLVISNCVLNLVADAEKRQLVREIHRVLKPGGRIAISDIVSDRAVPRAWKEDSELWSGCISGAFQEYELLQVFADTGFRAVGYDRWDAQPWRVIDGIAFRAVTLTAVKDLPQTDDRPVHSVLYRGPWAAVIDDSGRQYRRGERIAVSAAQHALLTGTAYGDSVIDPLATTPGAASCCADNTPAAQPLPTPDSGCCG